MLCELRARQLGVIEDLTLIFGPGMTAVTGETGAGKTMVVGALQLLVGGRADPLLVRSGESEAVVEGRFCAEGAEAETVLCRVVAAQGRSRAYVDGRMATVAALGEAGAALVDLHGQHAHQSLLSPSAQRAALDRYAGISTARRDKARRRVADLEKQLAKVGGDREAREREAMLLQYQLAEIAKAAVEGPDEDDRLREELELLSMAAAYRAAAQGAYQGVVGEDELLDRLGSVVASLQSTPPLSVIEQRLRSVLAELGDLAEDLRRLGETIEEDPQRLAEVGERRAVLRDLVRKYAGGGGLAEVLEWEAGARERLARLDADGSRAAALALELEEARSELSSACEELGMARRLAAEGFAAAVQTELRELAMPRARFVVSTSEPGDAACGDAAHAQALDGSDVEDGAEQALRRLASDDVTFLLGANTGEVLAPLARVASGGELARAMLALRLVLLRRPQPEVRPGLRGAPEDDPTEIELEQGPSTLVFDEVDAGVGGEAAVAVGRALARLGERYQVLVVTHLAQVAAFAGSQVVVTKYDDGARTVSTAALVEGPERVVELARMLSGQPTSKAAQRHARELLSQRPGLLLS